MLDAAMTATAARPGFRDEPHCRAPSVLNTRTLLQSLQKPMIRGEFSFALRP
jgi:hypothetical protein